MVYIDGTKYACEACVKGHRSSSCAHTERPLFEIKKKGRPVTQCEHCRQLRKTKQVHVKCSCEADTEEKKSPPGKAKRKLPTEPAFPEGLKGVVASTSYSPSPAPPRKRKVDHACPAASGGECTCATPVPRTRASSVSASPGPATPPPAASSCCSSKSEPQAPPRIAHHGPHPLAGFAQPYIPAQQTFNYGPPYVRGLYAPPPPPTPELAWSPNVGAGACSCGITCTCPGCFEHADPSTALSSGESCPYSCSTCNDCAGFGFAPDPNATAVPVPAPTQNLMWTDPDLTPWATPARPVASVVAPEPSVCCGGACKCAAGGGVPCQCADSCCGCCFGCACSDSDTVGGEADLFDSVPPRLGFAVSGERGSCCSEEKRGECAADTDGDGSKRKRRRTEQGGGNDYASGSVSKVGTAQARDPYRGFGQTPTQYPSRAGGEIQRWPSESR